jgi:MEMO1 family protein
MNRRPAVAGYFYPDSPQALITMIKSFLPANIQKRKAKGILVPHAGYIYSGSTAGMVYGSIELPDTLIILCPNHTGRGESIAIIDEGAWITPLGEVSINTNLAHMILHNDPNTAIDVKAHKEEHSLEVQLPFIQYIKQTFNFVPVCIRAHQYEKMVQLGNAIAKAINDSNLDVLIIASSDMTHYEPAKSAEKKDKLAIEQMLALDAHGLYDTVMINHISMCGVLPATALLSALNKLKASRGELIDYTNSGEKTGDYSEVVAYAGMAFF